MKTKKLLALASGMWLGLLAFSSPAATFDLTEIQKLYANDPALNDSFGDHIALSGDTAVIGASWADDAAGAAYVFTKSGGSWSLQQKLTVSDGAAWDMFGSSVAVDGDTALIGAPGNSGEGSERTGAAYVFTRTGGVWNQQAKLTIDDPADYDNFGSSVLVAGNMAMIGAPGDDAYRGAVYLFTQTGDVWTQQAQLTAAVRSPNSFGQALAIVGDSLFIGAPDHYYSRGAAYVFRWNGSSWAQQQILMANDAQNYDRFGCSVAVDGDTAVIGAFVEDTPDSDSGSAYVFSLVDGEWKEQAKLATDDCEAGSHCGVSVAVSGDMALVGSQYKGTNWGGGVYVFTRTEDSWTYQGKMIPSDLADSDWYGFSVAAYAGTAMAGAPADDGVDNNCSQCGAVYVFGLPQATDETPPVVTDLAVNDVVYPADAMVTATATDQDSNIESADYSFEGGDWAPMDATDEVFDEKSEDLEATIAGPLSVDTYQVCVQATDAEGNESSGEDCDTFAVTAATMTITFDGEFLDLNGSPTLLKATVTGPNACRQGATVEFHEGTPKLGQATTNSSGVAQLWYGLSYAVHEITVEVLDRDFDGDGTIECAGGNYTGSAVVADPNAASSGGGWYKVDSVAPPRVNFGYVANVKYNKKTQEFITTGNLLWMNQDNFKLKGVINQSGKFDCPTSDHAQCAAFAGTGILYEHNDSYDPEVDLPSEEWAGNSPLEVSFEATVYDGGSSTVCQKKRCTVTERPDAIMMQIHGASIPAAPYEIITLQGGSISVKK